MKQKSIILKYIGLVVLFKIFINLISFLSVFSTVLNDVLYEYSILTYIPFLYGLIIIVVALIDYNKISVPILIFVGLLLATFLDYSIGSILICIALLRKTLLVKDDDFQLFPLDDTRNM